YCAEVALRSETAFAPCGGFPDFADGSPRVAPAGRGLHPWLTAGARGAGSEGERARAIASMTRVISCSARTATRIVRAPKTGLMLAQLRMKMPWSAQDRVMAAASGAF